MALLRPIQIGNITIADPVILAPMTGVSDMPFRTLVRRYGSGLNVTEMIASQAAIRETRQSLQKAAWHPVEEPVSMQLVGCTPYEMGEAAKLNEEALAVRKRVLPKDHPQTLMCMNNLGIIYAELNRPAEALKLFEEVLPIRRQWRRPGRRVRTAGWAPA